MSEQTPSVYVSEKPCISVVVPVYNVEPYLRRCLQSLQAQTFVSFEILFIDDGSTDGSGEYCEKLAEEDNRIRVVHQVNGGVSAARNTGMALAQGDFLAFIDADDVISPRMFEVLYNGACSHQADIAAGKNKRVKVGFDFLSLEPQENESFVCNGEEAFGYALLGTKVSGSMCDKLIRRSFLRGARFPEGIIYEDALLMSQIFPLCKKVFVTTELLYYYTYREGSATTTAFDARALDVISVYTSIEDLVVKKYPCLKSQARFRLLWAYYTALDRMLLQDNYRSIEKFDEILNYLQANTLSVLRDPYFRLTRKIGAVTLRIHVNLYRRLVLWQNRKTKGSSL